MHAIMFFLIIKKHIFSIRRPLELNFRTVLVVLDSAQLMRHHRKVGEVFDMRNQTCMEVASDGPNGNQLIDTPAFVSLIGCNH